MNEKNERTLELSVVVHASIERVWRAITEGEEISRWFAPEARVTPGLGGTVWLSWGGDAEGEGVITAWEPNRRLSVGEPGGMVIDYIIEKKGSGALLRIVQSGFGENSDDQYDATLGAWQYFLYNLRHYLERHPDESRHMISVRHPMTLSREKAWPLLIGESGFSLIADDSRPGAGYSIRIGAASYRGELALLREARNLAGTIRELNDGLLFIELEAGEPWHCGVWLSVYGERPDVDGLRTSLETMLNRLFPVAPA